MCAVGSPFVPWGLLGYTQWLQQGVVCAHVVDDGGPGGLPPLGVKLFSSVPGFGLLWWGGGR